MTGAGKNLSINQKLILTVVIFGIAGVNIFVVDNRVWKQFVFDNHLYQMTFLCLFGLGLYLGACFVRAYNVKAIEHSCFAIQLFTISLMLAFPLLRKSICVWIILGVTAGILNATLLYMGIYSLSTENRARAIGICIFFIYFINYSLNYILTITGLNVLFTLVIGIFIACIFLNRRIDSQEMAPHQFEKHSTPYMLIILIGVLIFISYFKNHLIGCGIHYLTSSDGRAQAWLFQIIRLLVFFAFIMIGKNLNYIIVICLYLACEMFTCFFSLPPFKIDLLNVAFFNIAGGLFEIWVFNLIAQIAYQHGRKPWVLSCLLLSEAIGIAAASYLGETLHISNNSILFFSILLLLFSSYIILLPYLFKHISSDLDGPKISWRAVTSDTALFNHSLKNMIVQVSCGIEVLKRTPKIINEQIQKTLDIMSDSVDQMMDIVKNIHSNAAEIKSIKKPCNIEEIIDSVIDSIQLLEFGSKIDFIKICDPNVWLNCDRKRVKETLYNIAKNACEAMINVEGEVKIEVTKARKKIICNISDNGKGIPQSQVQKVFKPFYTTKNLANNNYGLGLTYCYIVMEQHKGTIEIESEENKGTRVSLIFPI